MMLIADRTNDGALAATCSRSRRRCMKRSDPAARRHGLRSFSYQRLLPKAQAIRDQPKGK